MYKINFFFNNVLFIIQMNDEYRGKILINIKEYLYFQVYVMCQNKGIKDIKYFN